MTRHAASSAGIIEQCIKHAALVTGINEAEAEQVVLHQWRAVLAATKTKWSIELSGIGYLSCSPAKVRHDLEKAQRIMRSYRNQQQAELTTCQQATLARRMESCQALIDRHQKRLCDEDRLEGFAAGNVQFHGRKDLDQATGGVPV